MNFLATMVRESRSRLRRDMLREPLADLVARAGDSPTVPAYVPDGFEVWAELKPRSPSEGNLMEGGHQSLVERALAYTRGGASVLSVLTEPSRFGGSLDLLETVARETPLPIMRKDFLVHPFQVWQARAAGAAGVLLIAGIHSDDELSSMLAAAREAGMFVLLETFDQVELDRAARLAEDAGPSVLLGVNCRDLTTLEVSPSRFGEIRLPGRRVLAESGVADAADAAAVAVLGYGGVLAGSTLMRSEQPETLVRQLLASGRSACLPA